MEISLDRYWTALGRFVAVFSGALVVLLGLLADVPLLTACARGFAAYVAVRVVTRVGAWAIAWTGSLTPREEAIEASQEVPRG
ncbi:MAG: hypothetical protein H6831_11495 [Planctomycetes bacterium]|nr:hypothetical protein [Planctomycetota bacterium]MCB9905024.1 hypothetical protein [Planctomycetota bacterium]